MTVQLKALTLDHFSELWSLSNMSRYSVGIRCFLRYHILEMHLLSTMLTFLTSATLISIQMCNIPWPPAVTTVKLQFGIQEIRRSD